MCGYGRYQVDRQFAAARVPAAPDQCRSAYLSSARSASMMLRMKFAAGAAAFSLAFLGALLTAESLILKRSILTAWVPKRHQRARQARGTNQRGTSGIASSRECSTRTLLAMMSAVGMIRSGTSTRPAPAASTARAPLRRCLRTPGSLSPEHPVVRPPADRRRDLACRTRPHRRQPPPEKVQNAHRREPFFDFMPCR